MWQCGSVEGNVCLQSAAHALLAEGKLSRSEQARAGGASLGSDLWLWPAWEICPALNGCARRNVLLLSGHAPLGGE